MANTRKCLSTDDEFRRAVAESLSVRQVLDRIGLVPAGGNYKTVQTRNRPAGAGHGALYGRGVESGGTVS